MVEDQVRLVFETLGIALGLGLLVGLQRESARSSIGGLRTFGITAVLGALTGILAPAMGGWLVASMLIALSTLIVISNIAKFRSGAHDPGMTTEVALLLMFMIGVYLHHGHRPVALILGGLLAVLLQAKQPFSKAMEKLGTRDVHAIMRFVLLSLVILPLLPDETYGPYDVLNPFEIWLLVVLIVGISLGGYIIYRFFGERAGVLGGGILGGMISSTATAVSYARRVRQSADAAPLAAVVIIISTAVVLVRVMVEIAVVAPGILREVALPFVILLVLAIGLSLAFWWRVRSDEQEMPEQENPAELKPAIIFAALYAAVLLAVAWARDHWGSAGLYVVAVIAGLTDVDAITLSNAKLAASGGIAPSTAWRLIVVAFISNLVFKAAIAGFLGGVRLLKLVALLFGLLAIAGGAMILWWPR